MKGSALFWLFAISIFLAFCAIHTSIKFQTPFTIAQDDKVALHALDNNKYAPKPSISRISYPNDGIEKGILSNKPHSFFQKSRDVVDQDNNTERCARYNFTFNPNVNINRRIFYGVIMADEPWELFEIISTESYAMFSAMVFVEANLTQSLYPREFKRLRHGNLLKQLFGSNKILVQPFINNNPRLKHLNREHAQRQKILDGWAALGMQEDDVGLMADMDETFSRDFLQAIKVCDGIDLFDHKKHHCKHNHVKITAVGLNWETSPECITRPDYSFNRPNMIIGGCIEQIGNLSEHSLAPRHHRGFFRANGFGNNCHDWSGEAKITDDRYPLWNGADFRRTCGGRTVETNTVVSPEYSRYTAFHFHNFVTDLNSTRRKYLTYGHPMHNAFDIPLHKMNPELKMLYKCAKDIPNDEERGHKRIIGGFNSVKHKPLPIYFEDEEYRKRRHDLIVRMVFLDDKILKNRTAQKKK